MTITDNNTDQPSHSYI